MQIEFPENESSQRPPPPHGSGISESVIQEFSADCEPAIQRHQMEREFGILLAAVVYSTVNGQVTVRDTTMLNARNLVLERIEDTKNRRTIFRIKNEIDRE